MRCVSGGTAGDQGGERHVRHPRNAGAPRSDDGTAGPGRTDVLPPTTTRLMGGTPGYNGTVMAKIYPSGIRSFRRRHTIRATVAGLTGGCPNHSAIPRLADPSRFRRFLTQPDTSSPVLVPREVVSCPHAARRAFPPGSCRSVVPLGAATMTVWRRDTAIPARPARFPDAASISVEPGLT